MRYAVPDIQEELTANHATRDIYCFRQKDNFYPPDPLPEDLVFKAWEKTSEVHFFTQKRKERKKITDKRSKKTHSLKGRFGTVRFNQT